MLMHFVSSFAVLAPVTVAGTGHTRSFCDTGYNHCRCSAAYPSSLLKPRKGLF